MRTVLRFILVAALGLSFCVDARATEPTLKATSAVSAVELYPDHALVTRKVEVGRLDPNRPFQQDLVAIATIFLPDAERIPFLQREQKVPGRPADEFADFQAAIDHLQGGPVKVTVSDLPEKIVADSLFLEGGDHCLLRGVEFKTAAKQQTPDTKALDAALKRVAVDIAANTLATKALSDRKTALTKLEQFVLAPATITFSRRFFNVGQPERLIRFLTDQREEIRQEEDRLANVLFGLNRSKDEWTKAREKLVAKSKSVTVREATLLIDKRGSSNASLQLRYVVKNVSWSPSYKLDVTNNLATFAFERIAMIQQASGEDWSDIRLTLSLQPPLLNASPPALTPFVQQNLRGNLNPKLTDGMEARKQATIKARGFVGRADIGAMQNPNPFSPLIGTVNAPPRKELDDELNLAGGELQMSEIVLNQTAAGQNQNRSPQVEASQVGFTDAQPLDHINLSNSTARQLLTLDQRLVPLTGTPTIRKTAIPLLSPSIYDEAELTNTAGGPLAPGPMEIVRDGRMVGQVELRDAAATDSLAVSPGGTFRVGLGVDPRLSTSRQLLTRLPNPNGSFTFTYTLTINNPALINANVTLRDRLPNITRRPASAPTNLSPFPLLFDATDQTLTWQIGLLGQRQIVVRYSFML
jgi:hypothetical protein